MNEATYGYTKNLGKVPFEQAEERIRAALQGQGFGVLTEIDVKATLKKKLDVDFRRYKILGACNPPLAHKAMSTDPLIGLMLPCNVILYEEDDGTVTTSFANPVEMFKIVNHPGVAELVSTVDKKIRDAFAAV
jgi:uncharacterized protein (DUF302 family)